MRAWLIIGLLGIAATQPFQERQDARAPEKHQEVKEQTPPPTVTVPQNQSATTKKTSYWHDAFAPSTLSNWALVAAAVGAIIVGVWTLRGIKRQSVLLARSVDAQIASERAWVDGEIIKHTDIVTHYSVKITNHGKTPALILSYEISHGLLTKGTEFSPERLSNQGLRSLHIFLGSGGTWSLEEFNIKDVFAELEGIENGAFCVTIRYGDVVTEGQERRREHETSFAYYYRALLTDLERISVYNKYT